MVIHRCFIAFVIIFTSQGKSHTPPTRSCMMARIDLYTPLEPDILKSSVYAKKYISKTAVITERIDLYQSSRAEAPYFPIADRWL